MTHKTTNNSATAPPFPISTQPQPVWRVLHLSDRKNGYDGNEGSSNVRKLGVEKAAYETLHCFEAPGRSNRGMIRKPKER